MKEDTATAKLFIGIDTHKRSWKVKTATDLFDGRAFTCPPDPETLRKYVEKNFPGYEVHCAYEVGPCGYSAHRAFISYGWHSLVVNPADIPRSQKSKYQKTDKLDAALICRELKDGRLKSIRVPSPEREALRCLFRRRIELVKDFLKTKSRILMQLLYLGVKIPDEYDKNPWTRAFLEWVRSLDLGFETSNYSLKTQLAHYEFLDKSIKEVSKQLRNYCRDNFKKDYELLLSVPGIGPIIACGILSELGDLRRFNTEKQLCSYVGLIPSLNQSGESSKTSGMTPRAKRIMRSYFIEAAWCAVRLDPSMQAYWRSHRGKDPKRIIVKVARKLLVRVRSVLISGVPYQMGLVK